MDSIESFVNNLQKENEILKKELEQAQKDIKDFENFAVIWRKNYIEMESKYKIKLANTKQIIEQLEKELEEFENKGIIWKMTKNQMISML